MTTAWVVGAGGLLGTALCHALRQRGTSLFFPVAPFNWGGGAMLGAQLAAAVQAFARQLPDGAPWEVYWAAGAGSMGSTADSLAPETHALAVLLRQIAAEPRLHAGVGAVAFASSAGAIYAGTSEDIITEQTLVAPTTAYAREKLKQEAMLQDFAQAFHRVGVLLARISTVYGPGQAAGKQQGLLTHIARRILRNQPVQIYVPYDTIRDYVTAADAAETMVAALRAVSDPPRLVLKIVASEHPTTIAEIVSVFKRIARRPPRVVTSASRLSALYTRRIQFRSTVLTDCRCTSATSLAVGVGQLMAAERASFVQAARSGTL